MPDNSNYLTQGENKIKNLKKEEINNKKCKTCAKQQLQQAKITEQNKTAATNKPYSRDKNDASTLDEFF